MYLMGQRDVTGTRVGENSTASDWTTSKQRERQSCLTLYLGSNTKVGASGKRNTCTCYFSSLLVFNRGLWFPAKKWLMLLCKDPSRWRRKLRMAGYSTGENSATSCILYPKETELKLQGGPDTGEQDHNFRKCQHSYPYGNKNKRL